MFWLSVAGGIFLLWLVLVFLFTPGINYHLGHRTSIHDHGLPLHAPVDLPGGAAPRQPRRRSSPTASTFYPAMLEAISRRRTRSTWSSTSSSPGRSPTSSSRRCRSEARQGVNVTIVVDAIGSFSLWGRPVRRLRKAGCRIESYQRLRWYSLARLNNRTHRELLVVDGRIAFIGGAGIADWWALSRSSDAWHKPWRDTMARIEGPLVVGAAGRGGRELAGVLRRDPHRAGLLPRPHKAGGDTTAFVVKSSPSDRATASRVTFQLLMEAADYERPHQHAVLPAGPRAATRAGGESRQPRRARQRHRAGHGAPIRAGCVSPAGACGDQLLEAGIRIFEYRETMTHAKVLIVDELWSVLGTTNIDNRSFEHNDEVNVAMRDAAVAGAPARGLRAGLRRQRRDHARRVAAAAAVGEDRRPVRLDPGAAAVTEAKSRAVRRRPRSRPTTSTAAAAWIGASCRRASSR